MYKIIRGSDRTAKSWSVGFIFDQGTKQEMRDSLSSLSNLMNHLRYKNNFKSKDKLLVNVAPKRTLQYSIVKD
jgi:hypothetical protein